MAQPFQLIRTARHMSGKVQIPGDKSISHRALMMAAVAPGISRIKNLGPGQDVSATQACLETMGIEILRRGSQCQIMGKALKDWKAPMMPLDAGNSGTTFRLLAGLLAGAPFDTTLTGDASLMKRPMARILTPLNQMGVKASSNEAGRAPVRLSPGPVRPIDYLSPVASAQVKSCVLLAGLSGRGEVRVTEPHLSRDHTERMLPAFGVPVKRQGLTVSLLGPGTLKPAEVEVPGDPSSAAYFAAAAAMVPESRVTLLNVGCNPTRTGFFEILTRMGAYLRWHHVWEQSGEPRGDLVVEQRPLSAIELTAGEVPACIDELPLLAVLATQAHGCSVLRHAAELRVKECDRIAMTTRNLKAMGATVTEHEDGWTIEGPTPLSGAAIETDHDHRMAMAFSVAGAVARGVTVIKGSDCASVSYPDFYKDLRSIGYV